MTPRPTRSAPAARPPAPPTTRRPPKERRGTVIVVVIALLGALMLLGFLFLTVTLQEEANSEYFAATYDAPPEVDPDVFFNWALEQLIVGPPDEARNSVLYGGHKSIVANMVGADLTPFDGTGIGTAWSTTDNRPALDLNRDGVVDAPQPNNGFALRLTHAMGSQPEALSPDAAIRGQVRAFLANLRNPNTLPAPDADFTYPDLNSAFLAYEWHEPVTGLKVTIPSFHRPQLLRNRAFANDFAADPATWPTVKDADGVAQPVHPWYVNAATLPFVMRPHLERRTVSVDPENPGNFGVRYENDAVTRRFVTGQYPDRALVDGSGLVDPDSTTLGAVSASDPGYVPPFDLRLNHEPLWRRGLSENPGDTPDQAYTDAAYADGYDADPDNDGRDDAVWLDLDFPVQRAGDGVRKYVPLFAVKIVDADALFNLNAVGNSYGSFADADNDGIDDSLTLNGRNFVDGGAPVGSISQSGAGLTTDEVNPQYGLSGLNTVTPTGPPGETRTAGADDVEAFSRFFDLEEMKARYPSWSRTENYWTGNELQSRNLEWWFVLHGRATFKNDPRGGGGRVTDEVEVGRYAERRRLEDGASRLNAAVLAAAANDAAVGAISSPAAMFFPYPGLTASDINHAAADDNGNAREGIRRQLPGLVFGSPRSTSGGTVGLPMFVGPEGIPLDRRGSGRVTDAATALTRIFTAQRTPNADPAVGLRFRLPSVINAVLPLFKAAGTGGGNPQARAGFGPTDAQLAAGADPAAEVGDFRVFRDWFGGAELHDDRTYTVTANTDAGTATQPLPAAGGAPGVSLAEPSTGATAAVVPGPNAPSLYGAAAGYGVPPGQESDFRQLNRLQLDDPAETVRDFDLAQGQRSDAIFGPQETAFLHMSDRDHRIAKVESRLLDLVPVSFSRAPGHEAVRARFTTASFAVNTAATPFEPPGLRSPGAEDRKWEFSGAGDPDDLANKARRTFPPTFGTVPAGDPADPFRPEVRALLSQASRNAEVTDDAATPNVDEFLQGQRDLRRLTRQLSFNGVVERVTNPRDPLFDATADVDVTGDGNPDGQGEIRIRPLTPHPAGLPAAPVFGPTGHPAGNPAAYTGNGGTVARFGLGDEALRKAALASPQYGLTTWDFRGSAMNAAQAAQAQEWHARRDRQNLARDLYVLLYTLGGVDPADPGKDYTAAAGGAPYDADQLREMAQVAANAVDAMDPDPVRTIFVYDKNLSDGYTLFDDGYANPPAANDADRGMVLGVERQDLALSEALINLAWAEKSDTDTQAQDHLLTEWDESAEAHEFLFLELIYTGAGAIDFGRNPATGEPGENWRVVVRDPNERREYRPDTGGGGGGGGNVAARAVVPRGGSVTAQRPYFTVASADSDAGIDDGAGGSRSRLRVNFEEQIADPPNSDANAPPWEELAPRPHLGTLAEQNALAGIVATSAAGSGAQLLDLLVPGTPGNDQPFLLYGVTPASAPDNGLLTHDGNTLTPGTEDLFHLADRPGAKAAPPKVEILLQTRLNPLRAAHFDDPGTVPGNLADRERDNPWVTVDRMIAETTRLDLFADDDNDDGDANTPPGGKFAAHFQDRAAPGPQTGEGPKVVSRVRPRPLLRASELIASERTSAEHSVIGGGVDPATTTRYNSLGTHDYNAPRTAAGVPKPFDLWVPHFDREFASPADFMGVPLYDAEHLTGLFRDFTGGEFNAVPPEDRMVGLGRDGTPGQTQDTGARNSEAVLNERNVVGSRLLYPDVKRPTWQSYVNGGNIGPARFNSWYRVLQYVGTPRRTAEMTDAAFETVRVGPTARLNEDGGFDVGAMRHAGEINLNTLRHPSVLAGLADDPRVHEAPNFIGLPMQAAAVTPAGNGTVFDGDLYRALLLSRDGLDPLTLPGAWANAAGGTGGRAVLPGLALRGLSETANTVDAYPFGGFHAPARSVAGSNEDAARALREAMQFTPLRALPQPDPWIGTNSGTTLFANDGFEVADVLPRPFFGVGAANLNVDDATSNPADLDFTTRYRLLGKVLNSATHRSNVFLCWVQVDFFHARELAGVVPDDGNAANGAEANQRLVRIGARRGDSPRYRGLFLIDRSQVPALLRADHLPDGNPGPDGTPNSGDEAFTYSFARDDLSGGVKFPWQKLILHRQRIQ